MKTYIILIVSLLLSTVMGFCWGATGHEAIAQAAFLRLNPKASAAVSKILENSTVKEISSVISAATWPDDIRISEHPGKLVDTDGAKSFHGRFPGNRVWHFVDYPLDGTYSLTGTYSATNDVVHMLGHCIDVLEGTATDNWSKMKKEEALAWLIHLAGDIHQPLHNGEGFYSFHGAKATIITDPTKAAGNFADTGGNALHFGANNFHSFWDDDMVASVASKETNVVTAITNQLHTSTYPNGGQDYHQWPVAWATDSIKKAKQAYGGILKGKSIGSKDASHPSEIDITFSTATYKSKNDALVREQLAKAAYNLSELLNHINWQ